MNTKKICVYFSFMLFLLCGCENGEKLKERFDNVLGIQGGSYALICDFSEFGGFGEGYALEVYELSEKTVQLFVNDSKKKLKPLKIDNKKFFEYGWLNSPVDSNYKEIKNLSLEYYSGNGKIESRLIEIRRKLKGSDVFYSFYCYPDIINPREIDFFILDTKEKMLYVINSCL